MSNMHDAPQPQQLEWSSTLLDGKDVSLKAAEEAVAALGEGWRLPTMQELFALVDHSRTHPAIDTGRFPDTKVDWYWSGTPCFWDSDARWVVFFDYGYVGDGDNVSSRACVRACRVAPASQELTCNAYLHAVGDGEFDIIRKEWSDAPESIFIGADPMLAAAKEKGE